MRRNAVILFALCLVPLTGIAQVLVSGQTAAHFLKSGATSSQRSVNNGRPSFGWENDLFIDGRISDRVIAFSTVRVTEVQRIGFDEAAIRISDITPLHLNIQVGRFDLPFGNLGERRFPRRNALFGLPLLYEYETALPDRPTTAEEIVSARGKGGGMPLLDGGIYDIGAMVFGSVGILYYAAAVSSGTISETTYNSQNSNSDLGIVLRLAVTPFTGLTLGGAYAQGAYMEEADGPTAGGLNVNRYRQHAMELDAEFSHGHAVFYGEMVYNTWPTPLPEGEKDLSLLGYYVEAKYTLMPRLYVALRMSGLGFGKVALQQEERRWDYNVTEWEGGLGYFLERNVLLKIVRRETRIFGGTDPKDGLTVLQLAVAY